MYHIESRSYGYKLVLIGTIASDELRRWLDELRTQVDVVSEGLAVIIDARRLEGLQEDAAEVLGAGLRLLRESGISYADVIATREDVLPLFDALEGLPSLTVQVDPASVVEPRS